MRNEKRKPQIENVRIQPRMAQYIILMVDLIVFYLATLRVVGNISGAKWKIDVWCRQSGKAKIRFNKLWQNQNLLQPSNRDIRGRFNKSPRNSAIFKRGRKGEITTAEMSNKLELMPSCNLHIPQHHLLQPQFGAKL